MIDDNNNNSNKIIEIMIGITASRIMMMMVVVGVIKTRIIMTGVVITISVVGDVGVVEEIIGVITTNTMIKDIHSNKEVSIVSYLSRLGKLFNYVFFSQLGFSSRKQGNMERKYDLVPFVQFKKRQKHPRRSITFSRVAARITINLDYTILMKVISRTYENTFQMRGIN